MITLRGIFSDGDAADIRSDYRTMLGMDWSDEQAESKILELYAEFIGDPYEHILWIGLALSEWQAGRLSEKIKDKALGAIEHCLADNELIISWGENPARSPKLWEQAKQTLLSPQGERKKYSKPSSNYIKSPWEVGSTLALKCIDTKSSTDITRKYIDKYVLVQIVDIDTNKLVRYIEGKYEYDYVKLMLYGWVGNNLPNADEIATAKPIPFSVYKDIYRCKNMTVTKDGLKYLTLLGKQSVPIIPLSTFPEMLETLTAIVERARARGSNTKNIPLTFIDGGGLDVPYDSIIRMATKALYYRGFLPDNI